MGKQTKSKLIRLFTTRKEVTRPVMENILVGTLIGTLVGAMLRGCIGQLEILNLDWLIFVLIGLTIGVLSGFERARKEELEQTERNLEQEIRQSEKELQKTEDRYKNLFEGANDIIFTLNTESRFVEINSKFEEILGYKIEEWKGRSVYELVSSSCRDEAIKFYWETLKGETPRFELEFVHADGHVMSLALANSPVRDSEGEVVGVMGIARDISESKKIETLQNKFISHVSHELRTPLTAMREFVSLLLDNIPGQLNEKQKKYLERIEANIDRLGRIIENLLLVSRAESESVSLEKREVNLKELIDQVKGDLDAAAERKSIRLTTRCEDKVPLLYADPDKIIQVLTNLIGNALKFTPEGGGVEIGLKNDDQEVELWVQDNGIGIDPENQEKIFDRFQQIRIGHKLGRRGAGLGLAISREIVRLHRGTIRVESKLGHGSKFIFTLPRALAPKILLVDDDPDLVEMFKDFMKPQHYRVLSAYNGEEAIVKAIQEVPDLIILDIVMPKMNGYEVIGRLKENKNTCNIPIIILTGYGLDEERLDLLGSRALPFLYKPVVMKEFLQAIHETLNEIENK